MIKCALFSCYKKDGIEKLALALKSRYKIIASSGTAKYLRKKGIDCEEISKITGQKEILGGRYKTIHPLIIAGILARRDCEEDLKEIKEMKGILIDFVCCNLYPFFEKKSIENIDIGGVTLIRAAAKNYKWVTVLTSQEDFGWVIEKLKKNELTEEDRKYLAQKAFDYTAKFDIEIAKFMGSQKLYIVCDEFMDLRYGENPHQSAKFYRLEDYDGLSLFDLDKLHGKEISYNNLCDFETALLIVKSFKEPCCAIIKHQNPCGVAVADNICDAYLKAEQSDPLSSFGGIIGFNRTVDAETAEKISPKFIEGIIAPDFTQDAIAILCRKKRLILVKINFEKNLPSKIYRFISGGVLVQDADIFEDNYDEWKVVTEAHPDEEEWKCAKFAFKICRFIKSNAICIADSSQSLGIGAGQPNRVGAVEIAIKNMERFGLKREKMALASDGFFPFPDSVELGMKAGIKVFVQPGGSIRDKEVIEFCNKHGLKMIFTGRRHFRH